MGFQFGQRLCDCEAWTSLSQRAAPVRGARMPKATFVVATLAELVTTAYVTGVLSLRCSLRDLGFMGSLRVPFSL